MTSAAARIASCAQAWPRSVVYRHFYTIAETAPGVIKAVSPCLIKELSGVLLAQQHQLTERSHQQWQKRCATQCSTHPSQVAIRSKGTLFSALDACKRCHVVRGEAVPTFAMYFEIPPHAKQWRHITVVIALSRPSRLRTAPDAGAQRMRLLLEGRTQPEGVDIFSRLGCWCCAFASTSTPKAITTAAVIPSAGNIRRCDSDHS